MHLGRSPPYFCDVSALYLCEQGSYACLMKPTPKFSIIHNLRHILIPLFALCYILLTANSNPLLFVYREPNKV